MNAISKAVIRRALPALLPLLMTGCALTHGAAAKPADAPVVSRSATLTLTADDYRAMLAAQPREVLALNAGSQDRMRELVLDLHSDVALERQAQAEGIADIPLVAAQLAEARRRILSNALLLKARDAVTIPEDLTALKQERYLREKPKLWTLEGRKVAHILLTELDGCPCKVEPLAARADALYKALQNGADFAEAARQQSMDKGSAVNGGVLPDPIQRDGKTVIAFEDAVFALKKPGDISPPFPTQFGVHIVKLLEIVPPRQLSYEEVEKNIEAQVVGALRFNAMEQLRGAQYPDPTTIDFDALEAVLRELIPAAPVGPAVQPPPRKARGG
ncbi:peptidylprolyl isomerase [Fontimonas sp. SYSU GA230001]|uniref:peptidylprolyl isomerase n=1 Tax=Fontimonas sp. SYSU GA230001 TaxID=3142450 RepID=UPI0032B463AC